MRAARDNTPMGRMARLTEGKMRLAAALAAAGALCACARTPAAQQPPEPGDQMVARVDGQPVWTSDVKRQAVADRLIGPGDPLEVSSDLFRKALDEVIDTKVLADAALKLRLDRDPVAQHRLAAARERALESLMVENVVGKAVTPQAEDALYQDFLRNRTPAEEVRLRQIVVAAEPDAEAVKRELAGGAAFEAVAMERSIDAETRFKGGDLGEVTTDTLPQPIAEAVKGVKAGQLAGPVKVDAGWAVLRVDERKPEPPPSLDAVRPQLIQFLTYDQVKDLVLRLRSQAKIQMLIAAPPAAPGAPAEPASAPQPAQRTGGAAANAAPSSNIANSITE
jgi:peptidyl-prolyl cis-trans isomerase C